MRSEKETRFYMELVFLHENEVTEFCKI